MALSNFNIVIIINNQVTVTVRFVSPLLSNCYVSMPGLPSELISLILPVIGHRIMLCPFTFLDDWISPVVFHCLICLLIILRIIFIMCIIVIHVHWHVSFIGCYNIYIIIHIGNCPTKTILIY
ncbi:hypothetical protein AMTRI_Chr02g259100 [Amborella trichopoda]